MDNVLRVVYENGYKVVGVLLLIYIFIYIILWIIALSPF